jgi:hypothetical protein
VYQRGRPQHPRRSPRPQRVEVVAVVLQPRRASGGRRPGAGRRRPVAPNCGPRREPARTSRPAGGSPSATPRASVSATARATDGSPEPRPLRGEVPGANRPTRTSASSATTASTSGSRRPRWSAVRRGEVTRRPATSSTSAGSRAHWRTTSPRRFRASPRGAMISARRWAGRTPLRAARLRSSRRGHRRAGAAGGRLASAPPGRAGFRPVRRTSRKTATNRDDRSSAGVRIPPRRRRSRGRDRPARRELSPSPPSCGPGQTAITVGTIIGRRR